MSLTKTIRNDFSDVANEGVWPGIDSRFRLIIVAGLRTKQLLHGSHPRIEADPLRRRNTTIALEEVKRGLVPFKVPVMKDNGEDYDRPLTGKSQTLA
jgi:DNA-directed RNA polymerase omega subunit